MPPSSYRRLMHHHRPRKQLPDLFDQLAKILWQYHHSKKGLLRHESFQLHHVHFHCDLDNQLSHRVDVIYQNRQFFQLTTCAHNFDGRYQKLQHLLVNQRCDEWQLLIQQHPNLVLSGRQILRLVQLKNF